jgi:hypothetical protein
MMASPDYTVAWICALPVEAAAARAILDRTRPLPHGFTDPNAYELGELNGHYVVIVLLPLGVHGTVAAATVVTAMMSTFRRLRFGIMVGIGGGVPGEQNDIRLGDVVVSKPGVRHSSVIQYAYGKTIPGEFEQTGTLNIGSRDDDEHLLWLSVSSHSLITCQGSLIHLLCLCLQLSCASCRIKC